MTRQLAFDLPAQTAYRRADFFPSPANALALAMVDGWRDWPGGRMLLLGPAGSGKTHLAHLWADATGAALLPAAGLGTADLPSLAARGSVAIEDAEGAAGQPADEAALFHLHNMLAPAGRLLLTAARPPRDWGLGLPDLLSRMQAVAVTRLSAPDDALLAAVLVKLFADRQLEVSPSLIGWLTGRMERSLAFARDMVAALDARALARGGPVTRTLAAEVLDSMAAR